MNLEEALKPAKHFEALITKSLERGYLSPLCGEEYDDYVNPIPWQTMRSVARHAFKAMKRPFIIIYGRPVGGVSVTVPKRRYTAPIINHLLLVARQAFDAPVRVWYGATVWHFVIRDKDIAEHFLNVHLKTPEVRKAMRLPAEVA